MIATNTYFVRVDSVISCGLKASTKDMLLVIVRNSEPFPSLKPKNIWLIFYVLFGFQRLESLDVYNSNFISTTLTEGEV